MQVPTLTGVQRSEAPVFAILSQETLEQHTAGRGVKNDCYQKLVPGFKY